MVGLERGKGGREGRRGKEGKSEDLGEGSGRLAGRQAGVNHQVVMARLLSATRPLAGKKVAFTGALQRHS